MKNQLSEGKKINHIQVLCYCILWKKESINLDAFRDKAASSGTWVWGAVGAELCFVAAVPPLLLLCPL